jgi:hypothetical protein
VQEFVRLCSAQHKRTYVVTEIMLYRERFIRWYGIGARIAGNITMKPIAPKPGSCLRLRPVVHAATGPAG